MANVKVNTISKVSGNNVAMQNSLNLKSYTTSARDALTSAAGDIIYNSDDNKVQFYNGTSWNRFIMSTLETNSIGKYSGNNVSIDDPLKLKNVTTTQRDALSSPQAGDTVYNSTTGTIDYYNGTQWNQNQAGNTFVFNCSYLVIAGGGSGARLVLIWFWWWWSWRLS